MHEVQPRAATLGRQLDLDRRRPGLDRARRVALLPAPGEDEPVRRIELDVLTGRMCPGITSHQNIPPGCGSSFALVPFHCLSFSGSTKNSQTVSGLASIEIVRSTMAVSVVASMLPSLLLLCFAFEGFQAQIPEALEELAELLDALGPHAVQASRAVPSLAHEPRLLENVQMLGDRRA